MKYLHKLCCCLLLVSLLPIVALAAGQGVTLTSSADTVKAGDTFTVQAVLENSDAIAMASVALDFDKNVFELTGGSCHVAGALLGEVLAKDQVGMFVLMLPQKVSGEIFTFQFRVKDDAPRGTYQITAESTVGDLQGSLIPSQGAQIEIGCAHTPLDQWHKNQGEHWHICSECGQRMDIAGHTLTNQSCTVCAYQVTGGQTGAEDQTPVQTPVQTPDTSQPSPSQRPEDATQPNETAKVEETTQATEQTQAVLPSENEAQTEATEMTPPKDTTSSEKDGKLWWIVILPILGLAAAWFVIWKKKK